ncbi:MAG: patatin-like phospholipase family protein [Gammaproteobacteria bacterium]|nr:patatin-like phospholipase family protein [Gammaproteobacteria bacterium]
MAGESLRHPRIGLVLPGGGARGAYQVGAMKAIAELMPPGSPNPFSIMTGMSAGAINATVLASNARRFQSGVRRLNAVWSNFAIEQVYRADSWTMLKSSLHWLLTFTTGGLGVGNPRSLLDNAPLRELLEGHIHFGGIEQAIESGALHALAVTASGYECARAVSFFEGCDDLKPWLRSRREGRRTRINLDHLMGSVAVPFIFPPTRVGDEFFGDGAIRESAPLSAAVHLGADRLLVVGVRDEGSRERGETEGATLPSFGQIAGYMLDTIFLDGLYADLERLTRINRIVAQFPPGTLEKSLGENLKRIDTMIIVPSKDIREIARRHASEFPRSVRLLLRGLGAFNAGSSQLISYLLFEKAYCRELIELGYEDAMARRDHLLPFISGEAVEVLDAPRHLEAALGN